MNKEQNKCVDFSHSENCSGKHIGAYCMPQEPMEWESEWNERKKYYIIPREISEDITKYLCSQIKQAEERGYASGCSNPNYNDGYEEGVKAERERIVKEIEKEFINGFDKRNRTLQEIINKITIK